MRVLVAGCAWMVLAAAPAWAQDGAALYTQRCASCHEGGQVARAPARDVIASLTPERIVGALETGTMRVQGETLTPEQKKAIMEERAAETKRKADEKVKNRPAPRGPSRISVGTR